MSKMIVRYRVVGAFAILLIVMIGVCGCTMNNTESSKNTNSSAYLSERQKSILTELGLSKDFNRLTGSQQKSIDSIEKMLQYVEDKYNMPFSYAGYIPEGSMEKEHMRAYLASGNMETESFTITKTDTGYEDDFINVAASNTFSNYVCEGIKTFENRTVVKVFSEITKTSLKSVPIVNSEFDGNVESSLWVFIDGSIFAKEDLSKFTNQFKEFMRKHGLYGNAQIILLKENKIMYPTKYNYTDYLSEEYYIIRKNVYLNK